MAKETGSEISFQDAANTAMRVEMVLSHGGDQGSDKRSRYSGGFSGASSGGGGCAASESGLQTLRDSQLYTKFLKCEFWLSSVAFLGHVVSAEDVVEPSVRDDVRIDVHEVEEETQEVVNPSREHVIDMPEPVVPKARAPLPRPPPPYPQRFAKQKGDNQFKKFIEMMKSLTINVPLVEALEQMPGYAKFMKDLVTKKRSMECETINMTHQVSAIVHSMAPKLEDPGAFSIPCTIGSADFAKALCDLGVDFEVPIILGRPFLATRKALVDVEAGELTFRVGDEKVVFHVCKSMRQSNSTEVCSFVNIVTTVIVDDTSAMVNVEDPLEAVLLNMDVDNDAGRVECVDATLAVLQKCKRAIGWTLADIRGISPAFYMHKIILEEDSSPSLEHQRRLNEAMQEVVKKEVIKWLDAGVVYPISDSSWTSPVQCVPKNGGMTVVTNANNELIPTWMVTGWRVCMDYRKLNKVTRKDHFPLSFLDQMLDHLASQSFYCFLDGYLGYNKILIAPEDQEKTTFTCPYGTFAFSRMPF
ncbi:uncharacterized protein [Nicotiana sylvestris]|uniref:uncharacterized protein n=1 Tax=Nicotiana sylvestris TaxID=4096 RepID=UPI00388C59F4